MESSNENDNSIGILFKTRDTLINTYLWYIKEPIEKNSDKLTSIRFEIQKIDDLIIKVIENGKY